MDLVKSVDGQFVFLVFLASFVWENFAKLEARSLKLPNLYNENVVYIYRCNVVKNQIR